MMWRFSLAVRCGAPQGVWRATCVLMRMSPRIRTHTQSHRPFTGASHAHVEKLAVSRVIPTGPWDGIGGTDKRDQYALLDEVEATMSTEVESLGQDFVYAPDARTLTRNLSDSLEAGSGVWENFQQLRECHPHELENLSPELLDMLFEYLRKGATDARLLQVFLDLRRARAPILGFHYASAIVAGARVSSVEHAEALFREGLTRHGNFSPIWGALMAVYVEHRDMERAQDVMDAMRGRRMMLHSRAFNLLMHGYTVVGDVEKLVATFRDLERVQPQPAAASYRQLFQGFASLGDLDRALDVLRILETKGGGPVKHYEYSTIIRMLGKRGRLKEAKTWFHRMKGRGFLPQPFMLEMMLNIAGKARDPSSARTYVDELSSMGVELSVFQCNDIIRAYGGDADAAYGVYEQMRRMGTKPDLTTFNLLLMAYRMRGDPEGAWNVLEEMERVGVVPDGFSFRLLLQTYGRAGDTHKCMLIFEFMKEQDLRLDTITYAGLMLAFAVQEQGELCEALFADMVESGLRPVEDIYSSLIRSQTEENPKRAMIWFKRMLDAQFIPDKYTLKLVITALLNDEQPLEALNYVMEMHDRGLLHNYDTTAVLHALIVSNHLIEAYDLFWVGLRRNILPAIPTLTRLARKLAPVDYEKAVVVFREAERAGARFSTHTLKLLKQYGEDAEEEKPLVAEKK